MEELSHCLSGSDSMQFIEVLYEMKTIHAVNYLISFLAGCLKT